MKRSIRIFYLSLIGFLIYVPYIGTIFFIRSDYDMEYMFISLICFLAMIIIYLIYVIIEKDKNYKYLVLVIIPAILIINYLLYSSVLSLANYYDYHVVRKDDLADLLEEVRNEEFKSIHSTRHKMIGSELTSNKLYSPNITDEKLDKIISKMKKYNFSYIHKDGNLIYFTNSGFIDSEAGYVFNENDEFPKMSPAGKIHTWQIVSKNWYYWYAD